MGRTTVEEGGGKRREKLRLPHCHEPMRVRS